MVSISKMLQFPYTSKPIRGSPPPSAIQPINLEPLVRVRLSKLKVDPQQTFTFCEALVDSGSHDTLFPLAVVKQLRLSPLAKSRGHKLKWRGLAHALQFAEVEDDAQSLRWRATVGFTDASLRYPILGGRGFFEFLDVNFGYGNGHFEISPGVNFKNAQLP
jgi:hypothetical protein